MKTILACAAAIMHFGFCISQTGEFAISHNSGFYEDARSIVNSADGNLLVTGLNKGKVDSTGSCYVMKLDNQGKILWQNFYDLKNEDGGNHILALKTGGYMISGHANERDDECNGILTKIDLDGNLIWQKEIGELKDDVFNASVENADGTIFSIGRTENYGASNMDILLCKTNSDGKSTSCYRFGTNDYDYGVNIHFTRDGNLLLLGTSVHGSNAETDILLIKCSLDGNLLWLKRFDFNGSDEAHACLEQPDGTFFIGGYKTDSKGILQTYLAQLTDKGEMMWDSTSNYTIRHQYTAGQEMNNRFLFTGYTQSQTDSNFVVFMDVREKNGELIFHKILENQVSKIPFSTLVNSEGMICISGQEKYSLDVSKTFVMKSNLGGNLSLIQTNVHSSGLIHPNPMLELSQITIPNHFSNKMLTVYSASGIKMIEKSYSTESISLFRNELKSGMYFIRVLDSQNGLLFSGRLMVQ